MNFGNRYTGLINKYRDHLPVSDDTRLISLGEGNTPLIKLQNIPKMIGKDVDIYVKYEGLNPTGSFKDRGMTMAMSKAAERGVKAVICASTGNTSAAAAAYAARAGMTPMALYSVLQKMTALGSQSPGLAQLYKTHPALDARMDRIDKRNYDGLKAYLARD